MAEEESTMLMWHPDLTAQGSKDEPMQVEKLQFPIWQARGWKRARSNAELPQEQTEPSDGTVVDINSEEES